MMFKKCITVSSDNDMTPFTDQRTTLQSLHSVTSQDMSEAKEHFGEAEKNFSFHSLEKILGLLASIIPKESSVSLKKKFICTPYRPSPLVAVQLEQCITSVPCGSVTACAPECKPLY